MSRSKPLKVIISGGGTGGHVFPALAIANALKEQVQNIRILFVGAKGRMEMKKVPDAGYHIIGLNISGLQRKFSWKNFLVPFKLAASLMSSRKIIRKFKPDLVIGVGGYASAPILRAATLAKVPSLIQEQNSYAGITNKILAKKVDKVCVAYENMDRFFPKEKIYLTGNPVRKMILDAANKKEEALKYFSLDEKKKVVLVVGGSLGALSINTAIQKSLSLLIENNIQLIWQTGKYFFDQAKQSVSKMQSDLLKVYEFIDRMDMAYGASDLVVSRAGAISVSEIAALNKPAILVPSPNVAEDHQTQNAMALVNINAAILVKDHLAGEILGPAIVELIYDEKKLFELQEKITRLAYKDAARNIATVALSLVKD
ncbi:MAG: undecaprenyldiphospho-muramoylpentapeptide beta-N-acetylglucosaminyltransferase [Bacteroidota bacterium]